jgi:hypothetical protein
LVVNILPGNTQVNKENQLTEETVSVPILLKVILYFAFFAYLFVFLIIMTKVSSMMKFLLHFTGPDLLLLVCGKWDTVL